MVGLLDSYFDPSMFQPQVPIQMPNVPMNLPQGSFPGSTLPPNATPAGPAMMTSQGQQSNSIAPINQHQQQPNFLNTLSNGLANHSNMLLALGAGLLSPGGYSAGLAGAMKGAQLDRGMANGIALGTAVNKLLISKGVDPAQAAPIAKVIASGSPAGQALGAKILSKLLPASTNNIKEFEYSQTHPGFTKFKSNVGNKFGLTPIYATDAQGKTVLLQPGTSGTPNIIQMPEGVTPSTGIDKIDLGTRWGIYDKRSGALIGYQPKDLRGKAAEQKIGAGQGKATVKYQELKSNLPMLAQTVDNLHQLGQKATYTLAGQAYNWLHREVGAGATPGDVARTAYSAYVRDSVLPILKATFGAQMTVIEGEKLESTLGDANLTPEQKDEALKAFITTKIREVNALARQSGQPMIPEPKFNFNTGQPVINAPSALPNGWTVKEH